jgi:cell wall-associated NlpC family hydrolase
MTALLLRLQYILFSIMMMMLIACQSSVRFSSARTASFDAEKRITLGNQPQKLTTLQHKIISSAEKFLGVPYCWGGTSDDCMDCSGFVQRVYGNVGVSLPRTAAEQFNAAKNINPKDSKAGDLVFFSFTGTGISHVGIYAGNNEVIHASSSRGVVRQPLDDTYLSAGFAAIRRIIPALTDK